jgi:hypothetical protein
MAEKRTRDVMEGLELKVLEQHKRYGPAPYDNCQCNFLIVIIKYATSVFPDVVCGNVVEGAFGYLQRVRAFEEECLSCAGPLLFKDYFSDVPGSGTVKCHVVDVFFLIAVGALISDVLGSRVT